MVINNEITPIGKSDILPSKELAKESQNQVIPVSSNSNLISELIFLQLTRYCNT